MLSQKRKKNVDFIILICVAGLLIFGLLAIYSATKGGQVESLENNFDRQILWVGFGLVLALIAALLPIGIIKEGSYLLYTLSLILLLVGAVAQGFFASGRWLTLGGLTGQPSEFAKLGVILGLSRFLGESERNPNLIKNILISFVIVLIPFILVAQQPDLATALVFIVILIPVLFWAGLNTFVIFVIATPVIVFFASFNYYTFTLVMALISIILYLSKRGALIFWTVFIVNVFMGLLAPLVWSQLRPYQQQRVLNYLGVVSDPQGVGYQIIQSKVAIGSGGLFGKGFLQGTQTQLRFLPAQHTDFIISVLAEEFGFIVIMLILTTLLILLLKGVAVAVATKDRFASLMVIGIVSALTFQVFVNIGMVTGLVPVAGVPLPFLSYGGSSMVVTLIMVALIHNVATRRAFY